jgi:hypothetical protein
MAEPSTNGTSLYLQSIENERSAEAYRILSEKAEKFYGIKSKDFDYSSEKASEYLEDMYYSDILQGVTNNYRMSLEKLELATLLAY